LVGVLVITPTKGENFFPKKGLLKNKPFFCLIGSKKKIFSNTPNPFYFFSH
jgi:hypothetical protein